MSNRHRPTWIHWLLGQYGRSPAALARRDASAKQVTAIYMTDQNPWESTGHHTPSLEEADESQLGSDEFDDASQPLVSTLAPPPATETTAGSSNAEDLPRAVNE